MKDFRMYPLLLSLFLLSSLHMTFASSFSSPKTVRQHRCLDDQRSALQQLHLQQILLNGSTSSTVELWDLETDCCSWDGVTCDTMGHVIGLDLGDRMLIAGHLDSIFHLNHLLHLNIARNFFGPIPSGFDKLGNLTHLNLSVSCFTDKILLGISHLTKLQSLDLSYAYDCENTHQFRIPNLKTLVQNLTSLIQLYLDRVDLSAQGENWCEALTNALPNLRALSLVDCGLSGPVCSSISQLPFLSELHLDYNKLSSLPHNFLANSSRLMFLSLDLCELQGTFPQHVFLLPQLRNIDISTNPLLRGQFPEFPFTSVIQSLQISFTNFNGELPESIGNLKFLTNLELGDCNFFGLIPPSIANLTNIVHLDLRANSFSGSIPSLITNLSSTVEIDLRYNSFSGLIPPFHGEVVPHLANLYLSNNQLNGIVETSLFILPSLKELDLSENHLTGELNHFPNASSSLLKRMDLSFNNLTGVIPNSIFQLPATVILAHNSFVEIEDISNASSSMLESLSLDHNNLRGRIPMSIFQLPRLTALTMGANKFTGTLNLDILENLTSLTTVDLSNIRLSFNNDNTSVTFPQLNDIKLSSCNLSEFPEFLKEQKDLRNLDLSNNQLRGQVPWWIWKRNLSLLDLSCNEISFPELPLQTSLQILDLSSNKIKGPIPNWIWNDNLYFANLSHNYIDAFDQIPITVSVASLWILDLHANKLQGSLPKVFCNLSRLMLLDASSNNFSGSIPNCLGSNMALEYLDLQQNNFQGRLPNFVEARSLRSIKLNDNNLDGELPMSLSNCTLLEVLDIGNNMIRGTFPYWLKKLPALGVLVLRGNKLHGHIDHLDAFPSLHIFDLSYNQFTGELSKDFLQSLVAMRIASNNISEVKYVGGSNPYYKESLKIVNKGLEMEMEMEKILTTFTAIDMSNNRFHGEIAEEIGNLKSLIVLNLSGNNFIGHIPSSLGKLRELESLDLSKNQLSGEIPQQLTSLTFLEVMNLSYNQIEGIIPQGNQFNTFSNASYKGNPRLCGLPLTRKCGEVHDAVPPPVEKDTSLFDWKVAMIGYGCGLVIGFSIGYTIIDQMGHKWFASLRRQKRYHRIGFIQRRGIQRRR